MSELKTDQKLLNLIAAARRHKMTPAEKVAQRLSFIRGQTGFSSDEILAVLPELSDAAVLSAANERIRRLEEALRQAKTALERYDFGVTTIVDQDAWGILHAALQADPKHWIVSFEIGAPERQEIYVQAETADEAREKACKDTTLENQWWDVKVVEDIDP